MELSVAIYQNNPSKVGKTIRLDSKYNRAGNNSKSGKDDFVDESLSNGHSIRSVKNDIS